MNNNDDFFATLNQPAPDMSPDDELFEAKTPGNLREDASKWDTYTDGQRKLIVFGVLLAVLLVLALVIGIGSSCGDGCSSCALCGKGSREVSGSDTADEQNPADEQTPADEHFPLYGLVSDSDEAPVVDNSADEPADIPAEDVPADTPADVPAETPDDVPAESPDEGETLSGADVTTASDAGKNTVSNDSGEEYVEVVQPGGFSSCVHHADNEAGDQSEQTGSGFLGFLFGCGGRSCNIDVSESLTDPVGDDPNRLDGMNPSGSDAQEDLWPAQPDDASYLELLRGQLTVISEQLFGLSELDIALAQYTDPQRVRENDRFRKVSEEMLKWCDAAEGYDGSALAGEQAHNCHLLSLHLATDLRTYIDSYPVLITGATSGTDVVSKDDQLNAILGDIVELYSALNTVPSATDETAEQE